MDKSQAAFTFSAENIPVNDHGNLYLWTFTFRDVVSVEAAKAFWSAFNDQMTKRARRGGAPFTGIRVFELHPGGHGLHVHVLTDAWWRVNDIRSAWQTIRWVTIGMRAKRALPGARSELVVGGRVHVKPIRGNRIGYVGKYLTKQGRPEALAGAKLWFRFGKFAGLVRVRDIFVESAFVDAYKGLCAALGETFKRLKWYQRGQAVENVLREKVWHFGLIGCQGFG